MAATIQFRLAALAFAALVFGALACAAQEKLIDTQRSSITIHVGKSGLFSAAGHEHWVSAPIENGSLDESASPSVRFTVDARKLTVRPDDKVSSKDQAEVQDTMQRKTLESGRYPEIRFQSTGVERAAPGAWKVSGTLTLHGVAKPVAAEVKRSGAVYTGSATIKQTDFGIQPISVGGVVKVKNELDIRFQIYADAAPSGRTKLP